MKTHGAGAALKDKSKLFVAAKLAALIQHLYKNSKVTLEIVPKV